MTSNYDMPMDFGEMSAQGDAQLLAMELGPKWKPWVRRSAGHIWEYGATCFTQLCYVKVRALLPDVAGERLMFQATIEGYPGCESMDEDARSAMRKAYELLQIYAKRIEFASDEIFELMPWVVESGK